MLDQLSIKKQLETLPLAEINQKKMKRIKILIQKKLIQEILGKLNYLVKSLKIILGIKNLNH